MDLAGRIALVTGGTRGIGETIAGTVLRRGATVALCSRDGAAARAMARTLDPSGDRTLGIACDVRDEDSVRAMVAAVTGRFGGLHLAVNNAGGPAEAPSR